MADIIDKKTGNDFDTTSDKNLEVYPPLSGAESTKRNKSSICGGGRSYRRFFPLPHSWLPVSLDEQLFCLVTYLLVDSTVNKMQYKNTSTNIIQNIQAYSVVWAAAGRKRVVTLRSRAVGGSFMYCSFTG